MKRTIKIHETKTKTKKKDHKSTMQIQHDIEQGVITPKEISELQGSLQELNNDDINSQNRTSGIDLRTRLYNTEISSITVLDTLVQFNFLPLSIVPFTLQKKRLAVSLKGKGREEIVNIVQGKRESDQNVGGKGLFGGLFNKKNE